jgi:hypothetical protein
LIATIARELRRYGLAILKGAAGNGDFGTDRILHGSSSAALTIVTIACAAARECDANHQWSESRQHRKSAAADWPNGANPRGFPRRVTLIGRAKPAPLDDGCKRGSSSAGR